MKTKRDLLLQALRERGSAELRTLAAEVGLSQENLIHQLHLLEDQVVIAGNTVHWVGEEAEEDQVQEVEQTEHEESGDPDDAHDTFLFDDDHPGVVGWEYGF